MDWVRLAAAELGLGDSAVAELKDADLVHSDGRVIDALGIPAMAVSARDGIEGKSWTSRPQSRAGGSTSARCSAGTAGDRAG
jgi:hypothetical protein